MQGKNEKSVLETERKAESMAVSQEQLKQKIGELEQLAAAEKKTLTYQNVMNRIADLEMNAEEIEE